MSKKWRRRQKGYEKSDLIGLKECKKQWFFLLPNPKNNKASYMYSYLLSAAPSENHCRSTPHSKPSCTQISARNAWGENRPRLPASGRKTPLLLGKQIRLEEMQHALTFLSLISYTNTLNLNTMSIYASPLLSMRDKFVRKMRKHFLN